MPIAFVSDFHYWTILATVFTFYTLASLELIAETIEDPFGLDPDDLPTDDLGNYHQEKHYRNQKSIDMAYDQNLADRVRDELDAQRAHYEELNMMGGLCFMVDDKMCVGISWRSINGSN